MIGELIGAACTAIFKANSTYETPLEDVKNWRKFDAHLGIFSSEYVEIKCLERTCDYLSLNLKSSNEVNYTLPEEYKGLYADHKKTLFGRPVYKHIQSEAYIYYHSSKARWIFGKEYDRGTGFLELESNATRPEDGGQWIDSSLNSTVFLKDVSLKCHRCGQIHTQFSNDELVQGDDVKFQGKWPFMIAILREDKELRCGAVLIAKDWFITAGHCGISVGDSVIAGALNLDDEAEKNRQISTIKAIYRHENFTHIASPFRVENDFSVVQLEKAFSFNQFVQPICLPTLTEPLESLTFIGWGGKGLDQQVGSVLNEATATTLPLKECNLFFPTFKWLIESHSICIAGQQAAKTCTGDSGGPLFKVTKDKTVILLGIASWTTTLCFPLGYPSVYADVRPFTNWIREKCQCF
ncbi:DgyrCDS1957 [Dimorphilus gyrociliatus]|uniref:DgyrCDS1957 n=1 Tax=Dimorphilus gyrociliatus TaxID=2664684 RepID=A0A7I8VBN5_9ANNE|nr:DgyrCDS1957 [Dimorphilus gyrociliatus]